jgi:hypothetical protein
MIEVKGIILGLFLNLTKCFIFGKHTDDFPDKVNSASVYYQLELVIVEKGRL